MHVWRGAGVLPCHNECKVTTVALRFTNVWAIFLENCCPNVVILVKVILVIFDFGSGHFAHYNKKNIFFIIVADFDFPFSILTNDQNDQNDRVSVYYPAEIICYHVDAERIYAEVMKRCNTLCVIAVKSRCYGSYR